MSFKSPCTQIFNRIFKQGSLSSTVFFNWPLLWKKLCFGLGCLHAAGVLDLPDESHIVYSPGSMALHPDYSLYSHYSCRQVVQSLLPLFLLSYSSFSPSHSTPRPAKPLFHNEDSNTSLALPRCRLHSKVGTWKVGWGEGRNNIQIFLKKVYA